jgi:hypothetical protein
MYKFYDIENTTTDAAQCRFAFVVEIHSWMSCTALNVNVVMPALFRRCGPYHPQDGRKLISIIIKFIYVIVNFVYEIINFIVTNVSKTFLLTPGAAGL